jgi:hypothetical protein
MGGAQPNEFAARIGKSLHRPELNLLDLRLLYLGQLGLSRWGLCLRRTGQYQPGDNRCGTDGKRHDGLTGNFLGSLSGPRR